MSINDMMKLQGVSAATRPALGEQASVDKKHTPQADSSAKSAASSPNGIAVEIASKIDAGQPPVAADRVREVRQALQNGSYPLLPAQTADAMIAARLSLAISS